MFPGRDVDVEIACRVWRSTVVIDREIGPLFCGEDGLVTVPHFSTDLNAANTIVAFLRSQGWRFRSKRDPKIGFIASFYRNDGTVYRYFRTDTLALSICAAALAVADGTCVQRRIESK